MVKDKLMAIAMKISILFIMVFMFNVTNVHAAGDEVYTIDNWEFKYITEDTIEIVGINFINGKNQNVTIPSNLIHNNKTVSVVRIGDMAFDQKSYITSIIIPEGVTSIGKSAFRECSGLTNITLPNGLKSIGNTAFWLCGRLTNVTLPNDLTSIGQCSFQDCSGLTNITFPNGLTSIGNAAFNNCDGLKNVYIPANIKKIGLNVFGNCTNLESIKVSSDNSVYDSRDNCNAIIETKSNKLIQACKNTRIPNSIKIIGDAAFHVDGLTTIDFPDGLASIEYSAFYNCDGLTTVKFPKELTSIGEYAFYNCSGLKTVNFPDGLTSIGSYAFFNCNGLTTINLPSGLTSIGEYAFDNCDGLTTINIPEGITILNDRIFSRCDNLISVTLPETIKVIKKDAFYNCPKITFKVVKGSIAEIWAIANGFSVEYYTPVKPDIKPTSTQDVSNSFIVTKKGKNPEVTLHIVKSYTKTNYIVPDTVNIGGIVYKVTAIETNAFKNNKKLKTVTIGSNVKIIGKNAFYGCKNLKKVIIKSKVISKIGKRAFKGTNKKIKFKCPKKKLKKYKKMIKKAGAPKKVFITSKKI